MRDLDIRGAGNLLGGEQSGFINEIGYDTYLKILQEAVEELKETEFKELFPTNNNEEYIKECIFESDLEIHIPDSYVEETTERINLYRSIDNINSEDALSNFEKELCDRFGPLPSQARALLNTLQLRWVAKKIGFEKLILKNGVLIGYFLTNEESPYYQSDSFTKILEFLKINHQTCKMQENNKRLSLTIKNIKTVEDALVCLNNISNVEMK